LSRPADLPPVGEVAAVKSTPVMQKVALPIQKIVQKAAPVVQKTISVAPSPPAALETNDLFAGVGLGLAPFVIIPTILFSTLKGLIKPAKPLPIPVKAKVTKGAYIKSFAEGRKEGLKEFFSGSGAENDLTQKTLKLSGAGFGSAVLLSAVLLSTSGSVKEVAKKAVSPSPTVKTAAPKVQANQAQAPEALKAEKALATAAAEKTGIE
jgi:hypothetical protein